MVESLEWDDRPLSRKSVVPGRGFFQASDREPDVTADEVASANVIVIADPDADGLTATALVKAAHGEATLVPSEPRSFDRALRFVAETIETPDAIYLLDLAPEEFDAIASPLEHFVEVADTVTWYDHHEWDDSIIDAVESLGVTLEIGESDEVATANVAFDALDIDESAWSEVVEVVRDHDLWLREDPRSDDIADYAHWSRPNDFIETVTDHGVDLPAEVLEMLSERREEKQALIDIAISRAEYRTIDAYTVGITYGRCSQNEVAEGMREAGSDVAVIIKPSGGISFRGTDTFQRCHEVAGELGGGGHPKAAGCKPNIYEDMLDFAHHWVTHGATARHEVLAAFDAVLNTK